MRILQVNTTVNTGSTGRIAEDIGKVLIKNGHESYIAFGRGNRPSESKALRIGSKKDILFHGFVSTIFDRHGFASSKATQKLIEQIKIIKPDAIGLHNLHGYYLNVKLLFKFLSYQKIPILWTLFDCWSFTGHCTYFDDIKCEKWKTQCNQCPKSNRYPASYVFDNSEKNFLEKKELLANVKDMELVVHSLWLKRLVSQSF